MLRGELCPAGAAECLLILLVLDVYIVDSSFVLAGKMMNVRVLKKAVADQTWIVELSYRRDVKPLETRF